MADLGDQLNIQKQIQQLLQDRESLLSREKDLVNDQIKVVQKLCKAMKKCKPPGKELDQMSRSMKSASKNTDRFSEKLESAAEKAGELKEKASGIADKIKGLALAGGGLLGLSSIFNKLTATATGLFSALGSVASAIFNIGLSILTIPLKIFSGIVEMAGAGGGGSNPLKQAMEDIREEFGSLASNEGKAVVSTLKLFRKNMKNVAQTGLRFHQIFAYGLQGMADVLKHNQELAVALKSSFNSMLKEFESAADIFYGVGKGLGFTADQQAALMKRSKRAGRDVVKDQLAMANMAIQMGRKFQVSSKQIGKSFGQMAEDADHFGHLTIEQMGAIATFANKLGIEIKELGSIIDKFLNFEDAAKGASQLASGLGIMVDSLKITNAAAAGDGAAIVSTLQDSFRKAGKTYDQLTYAQRRLVNQTTGMGEAAAQAAFGTKGLKTDYNDMTKAAGKANQEKMSTNDILKEMGKNIKRLVRSGGGGGFKGFFDAFAKGFARGVKRSKPFFKMLRTIRKALKATWRMGKAVGKMFVESFPGIKAMVEGLTEIFQPKRFNRFLGEIKDAFQEFFDVLAGPNPQEGVRGFLERLKTAFTSWLSGGSSGANSIFDGFKKFMKAVKAIIIGLAPIMMEGIIWVFKTIHDFMKDPSIAGDVFGVIGEVLVTFFNELYDAIEPYLPALSKVLQDVGILIGDALVEAWRYIEPKLIQFGSDMWDALWSTWYGKLIAVTMIAKIFAPLILIIVAVSTALIKGTIGMAAGMLSMLKGAGPQAGGFGQALQDLAGGGGATAGKALAGALALSMIIMAVGASLAAVIWAMGQGKGLTMESTGAFFLLAGGMLVGANAVLHFVDTMTDAFPGPDLKKMIPMLVVLGSVMFVIGMVTSAVLRAISEAAASGVTTGVISATVLLMTVLIGASMAIVAAAIPLAKLLTSVAGVFSPLIALVAAGIVGAMLLTMSAIVATFSSMLDDISEYLGKGPDMAVKAQALESFGNIIQGVVEAMSILPAVMVQLAYIKASLGAVEDPFESVNKMMKSIVDGINYMFTEFKKLKIQDYAIFEKKITLITNIIKAIEPILNIVTPVKNMKNANLSQLTNMIKQQGETLGKIFVSMGGFIEKIVTEMKRIEPGDLQSIRVSAQMISTFANLIQALGAPLQAAYGALKSSSFMGISGGVDADDVAAAGKSAAERLEGLMSGLSGPLGQMIETLSRSGLGGSYEAGMSPMQIEKRFKVFELVMKTYSTLMRLTTDAISALGDDGLLAVQAKSSHQRGIEVMIEQASGKNTDHSTGWRAAERLSAFMGELAKGMGETMDKFVRNLNPALASLGKLGDPATAMKKIDLLGKAMSIFSHMGKILNMARKYLPKDFNFLTSDAEKIGTMLSTIITTFSGGIGTAIKDGAKAIGEAIADPNVAKLAGKDKEIKAMGEVFAVLTKFSGFMGTVFSTMGWTPGQVMDEAAMESLASDIRKVTSIFVHGVMRSGLEQFGLVLGKYKVFKRNYSAELKNLGALINGFGLLGGAFKNIKGMLGGADVDTAEALMEKNLSAIIRLISPKAEGDKTNSLYTLGTTLRDNPFPLIGKGNTKAIKRMLPFIEQYTELAYKIGKVANADLSGTVANIILEAKEVADVLNRTESIGFEAALENFAQAVATGTGRKTYEIDPGRFNLNLTVEVKLGRKEMIGYLSGQAANATTRLQQKPK